MKKNFEEIVKFLFNLYNKDSDVAKTFCQYSSHSRDNDLDLRKLDSDSFEKVINNIIQNYYATNNKKDDNFDKFIAEVKETCNASYENMREFINDFYDAILLYVTPESFNNKKYRNAPLLLKKIFNMKNQEVQQFALRSFSDNLNCINDTNNKDNMNLYEAAMAKLFEKEQLVTVKDRYSLLRFYCAKNNINYNSKDKDIADIPNNVKTKILNIYNDLFEETLNQCKKELSKENYNEQNEESVKQYIEYCSYAFDDIIRLYPKEERDSLRSKFKQIFDYNKMMFGEFNIDYITKYQEATALENHELVKKNKTLEEENKKLTSENKSMDEHIDYLMSNNRENNETIKKLEKELSELKAKIEKLEEKEDSLKKNKEKLVKAIENIQVGIGSKNIKKAKQIAQESKGV